MKEASAEIANVSQQCESVTTNESEEMKTNGNGNGENNQYRK